MWNQKMKAITFSYDDGIEQDIRFIEMLDRYHLRGTFNLNLGLQDYNKTFQMGAITVHHVDRKDIPLIYQNHEVAGHSMTHPHLENLPEEEIYEEIHACQDGLQQLIGRAVVGMAYPFGTYDARVIHIARECGVQYARTTVQTEQFSLPTGDLLMLSSSCYSRNPKMLDLARKFVESHSDHPQLLYIWGHAYEFDQFGMWDTMEELCKIVANHSDIFYGTNCEVLAPLMKV